MFKYLVFRPDNSAEKKVKDLTKLIKTAKFSRFRERFAFPAIFMGNKVSRF